MRSVYTRRSAHAIRQSRGREPPEELPALTRPGSPDVAPPPLDFADAFEKVFTSLDRQARSVNLVSLVDLRRALPVDRETFDRELRELRRAGRFSLNAAEGRQGLTPEEREAAINEGGSLQLFVSRRR